MIENCCWSTVIKAQLHEKTAFHQHFGTSRHIILKLERKGHRCNVTTKVLLKHCDSLKFVYTLAACGDTLGSWWDQTQTKYSIWIRFQYCPTILVDSPGQNPPGFGAHMLALWSMEIIDRGERPRPLAINHVKQFYCQPLGQEKGKLFRRIFARMDSLIFAEFLILIIPTFLTKTLNDKMNIIRITNTHLPSIRRCLKIWKIFTAERK